VADKENGPLTELSDELIFAYGGRRICFIHPADSSRCIKTFGINGDPHKRRQEAVWYKKIRPLYYFDDNRREWVSFQQLMKYAAEVWNYFPRCYGLELTDRGLGIVTDLIRDNDGQISKMLADYAAEYGKSLELLAALEEFYELLRRHTIITRDILDHNLVVQNRSDGLRIVMIDGFGSSEIFPLSSWFPLLGKKKVERKIERFKLRYEF
jgi:hypothetical protein